MKIVELPDEPSPHDDGAHTDACSAAALRVVGHYSLPSSFPRGLNLVPPRHAAMPVDLVSQSHAPRSVCSSSGARFRQDGIDKSILVCNNCEEKVYKAHKDKHVCSAKRLSRKYGAGPNASGDSSATAAISARAEPLASACFSPVSSEIKPTPEKKKRSGECGAQKGPSKPSAELGEILAPVSICNKTTSKDSQDAEMVGVQQNSDRPGRPKVKTPEEKNRRGEGDAQKKPSKTGEKPGEILAPVSICNKTTPKDLKDAEIVGVQKTSDRPGRPKRKTQRPKYLCEIEVDETPKKRQRRHTKRVKKRAGGEKKKPQRRASFPTDVPPPPPKQPELTVTIESKGGNFGTTLPVHPTGNEAEAIASIPHGTVTASTVNPAASGETGRTLCTFKLVIPGYGPYTATASFPHAFAKILPPCADGDLQQVQCDRCKKWRKLPQGMDPASLPDEWYCDMNFWNRNQATCAANEERELGVISNRYHDDYCGVCLMDLKKADIKGDDLRIFHCIGNPKSCLRSFHAHCIGATADMSPNHFVCRACKFDTHLCFECGKGKSPRDPIFQCSHHCGKHYHKNCFQKVWKCFGDGSPEALENINMKEKKDKFVCPMHFCTVCGSSGCGQKLHKCVACPTSFHTKCKNDPAVSDMYPSNPTEVKKRKISDKGAFLCMKHKGVHKMCVAKTKQFRVRPGDEAEYNRARGVFHYKNTKNKVLVCHVCDGGDEASSNSLLACSDCGVLVHMTCYGIPPIPTQKAVKPWRCDPCNENRKEKGSRRKTSVSCAFCPVVDFGAFKRTAVNDRSVIGDGFDWVHVACACWVDGAGFGNPKNLEPIVCSYRNKGNGIENLLIDNKMSDALCDVCGTSHGICIKCSAPYCTKKFHVMCARNSPDMFLKMQWVEVEGKATQEIEWTAYCSDHARELNVRNAIGTTTFRFPKGASSKRYLGSIGTDSTVELDSAEQINGVDGMCLLEETATMAPNFVHAFFQQNNNGGNGDSPL